MDVVPVVLVSVVPVVVVLASVVLVPVPVAVVSVPAVVVSVPVVVVSVAVVLVSVPVVVVAVELVPPAPIAAGGTAGGVVSLARFGYEDGPQHAVESASGPVWGAWSNVIAISPSSL